MKTSTEIINALNQILEANEPERSELINSFQKIAFSDNQIEDEYLDEIVGDLAYDMDYYEPNEEWRKQDLSFYSEDRLKELISDVIKKIEKHPI